MPTDFDFVKPPIGLRKVIEKTQLRSRGNVPLIKEYGYWIVCAESQKNRAIYSMFESGTKKALLFIACSSRGQTKTLYFIEFSSRGQKQHCIF